MRSLQQISPTAADNGPSLGICPHLRRCPLMAAAVFSFCRESAVSGSGRSQERQRGREAQRERGETSMPSRSHRNTRVISLFVFFLFFFWEMINISHLTFVKGKTFRNLLHVFLFWFSVDFAVNTDLPQRIVSCQWAVFGWWVRNVSLNAATNQLP